MRVVMVCSAMRKKEKKTEVETLIKKKGGVLLSSLSNIYYLISRVI